MRALVLVDLQNDFVPGGALAVPEGDRIVPLCNRLQRHFDLVLATQDWHPADHGSFAANHPGRRPGEVIDLDGIEQVLWPVHCVQDTPGADFVSDLDLTHVRRVFRKGVDPRVDSYSAFFDNAHRRSTGLGEYLQEHDAWDVYLAGLATDYCVRYSVMDALELNLRTYVIADACRGIDLKPGDVAEALDAMSRAGAKVIDSEALLAEDHRG